MMQSYRKLKVWCKSMDMVDKVYAMTADFSKEEMFGLKSQIRRCAVSVPSNIAEGSQRNSKKEFLQFISIAYASLAELETQLEIAGRQKYVSRQALAGIFDFTAEVGRMLNGLSASFDKQLPTANRKLPTLEEIV